MKLTEKPVKKRLLFCTHDIELGGSPRSMAILVEELAERHDIAIVTMREPHPQNPALKKYQRLGIPVYFFPWGWLPVSYVNCPVNSEIHKRRREKMLPFAAQINELARTYDLVCINGYPAASLAELIPAKIPRVLLAREILLEEDGAYTDAAKYLRSHISAAIAIGPLESAQLRKFGIPNITVFNSSENVPEFKLMPQGSVKFGVFSRFGPGKGLTTLASAVAIAARSLRKAGASILVFGANPENPNALEEEIRKFSQESKISDILKLEPYTGDPQGQMEAVHCIIRPDDSGSPWGRDVIEAMSMGRPVLATGSLDVFVKQGKTGWLVPPGDSAALAQFMGKLAEKPELLEQAGRAAASFAVENFNRTRNSRRIEEYFLNTIAGKGR